MEPVHKVLLLRIDEGGCKEQEDQVATETSCTLTINGENLVTLLCSPMELDCMAVGFLVSEGLLNKRADLQSLKVNEETGTVHVTINNLPSDWHNLFHTKTLTSGCGKGITFTHQKRLESLSRLDTPLHMTTGALRSLLQQFKEQSTLFQTTGGVHSAALTDGRELLLFSEDIGRHNAVDKLIGKAFLHDLCLTDTILLSSGRISAEIMTKVIRSAIPVLITRTAPTCMSIAAAEDHGVTLIGFARGKRLNIYTHPGNIIFDDIEPTL